MPACCAAPADHLADLLARRPELEPLAADIRAAADLLLGCFRAGHGLLLCGNGGSAADAEHWAGELLKGFESRRPLPEARRLGLDADIAGKLQCGLPAIPLTGFEAGGTSVISFLRDFALPGRLYYALNLRYFTPVAVSLVRVVEYV